ncbi:MAG: orotidine-5'-phosphate decarboxylase [Oscillospiraceae bacterium]|jgi:orotidine-5'-phosphate decarboxylase|nr:orotidine-5'-phosphate decarboxylase [Oscillospiraceae bacterium]
MSLNRLIEKIAETQNPTVAGLDPKLEYVPGFIKEKAFAEHGETLKGAAKAIWLFNKGIIDAIHEIVPAVKPQLAFYEMLGIEGVKVFHETAEYARKYGMYVIADGKRNDIGSTAEGYASAYLGKVRVGENEYEPFPVDALTVNAYLGSDGITPFTDACKKYDKGIFVLVKTSNPSSGELQDKLISGVPVYEIMGRLCEEWGRESEKRYGYSGVGAVIGATYPEQIKEMREKLPNTFFLIPGYGAQGGRSGDLKAAFDSRGLGGIVNSSRAVMCAWQKEKCDEQDYAGAALREIIRMKNELIEITGEIKLK